MVAIIERPLPQMVLRCITWDTFERILDELGESPYRVTYTRGELEFTTLSFEHENFAEWMGRLIFFVAMELNLSIRRGGSTTLKEALRQVALEPDRCFWIQHAQQMRGKKKWRALDDPPPDLAIEIDITSSWLDRLAIYAALKVPEVWRYDGKKLRVLILGSNGKYKEKAKSLAFPTLPLTDFARFVGRLENEDEMILVREFTAWLRADVVGKPVKKNGKQKL